MIHEFGEFQLDPLRRVLCLRASAQPLQVTGRVFDTLLHLVEHAGQLLDKRTLMQAVWSDVVVEESNLTQTIHTLRRLLGERPDEHRFIVTVPNRGYRFVAPVTTRVAAEESGPAREPPAPPPLETPPRAASPEPRRRWQPLAIAASLAVVFGIALYFYAWGREIHGRSAALAAPSIAVLPFVDMSPAGDQEYLGDGLSEEILNVLAQSGGLRVIARTSSFSFKGEKVDIATIAQKLNVTHVLEGSVRKSGGRIRITAQLIDGSTSEHVWSQTYDREVADVIDVQTDIASAVADSLQVNLGHSERPSRGETRSAQAFELYLHGRYLFNRRGPTDVARAKEYFDRAIEIDPDYARAWAGLAGALYVADDANKRVPAQVWTQWRDAVERAVKLDPSLAEAQVRASQYYWAIGDARAAREHLQRAVALNPSDPLVMGVSVSPEIQAGRADERIERQRRVVALDPLSAQARENLGLFLLAAGHWDTAIGELRKALELSPASLHLHADISRARILQERFDEALAAAALAPEGPRRIQCYALIYHATGRDDAADALAQLIALAEMPDSDAGIKLAVAEVYAFRRERDAAFRWLDRAERQTRDDRAVVPGWWMRQEAQLSPFLESLHADPRWPSLLAAANTR